MKNFIEVYSDYDYPLLINIAHIITAEPYEGGGTLLRVAGSYKKHDNELMIPEPYEQVKAMIKEASR